MQTLDQSIRVTGKTQIKVQKSIDEATKEADERLVKYITAVMEKAQQIAAELVRKKKREAAPLLYSP